MAHAGREVHDLRVARRRQATDALRRVARRGNAEELEAAIIRAEDAGIADLEVVRRRLCYLQSCAAQVDDEVLSWQYAAVGEDENNPEDGGPTARWLARRRGDQPRSWQRTQSATRRRRRLQRPCGTRS